MTGGERLKSSRRETGEREMFSHFDVVNVDDVPTVVQILLQIFVLENKKETIIK